MIKITCDRCGKEWVGRKGPGEYIKIGEEWVDLCSECQRVYETIEDKVQDYRADLKDNFIKPTPINK